MYNMIPALKGPKSGIPTVKKVKITFEANRGNNISRKGEKTNLAEIRS